MGNVGASSKPIQDNKINTFDLEDGLLENKPQKKRTNPGSMEELHKRCKGETSRDN